MNESINNASLYGFEANGIGSYSLDSECREMVDTPTLIIGLGGTGTNALLHVKHALSCKVTAPKGKSMPDRVRFLAVDTDAEDLRSKH